MQLKISIFFEDFPLILSQHYAALVRDYVKVERAKSWPSNLKLEHGTTLDGTTIWNIYGTINYQTNMDQYGPNGKWIIYAQWVHMIDDASSFLSCALFVKGYMPTIAIMGPRYLRALGPPLRYSSDLWFLDCKALYQLLPIPAIPACQGSWPSNEPSSYLNNFFRIHMEHIKNVCRQFLFLEFGVMGVGNSWDTNNYF